jgi:Tol biopolymer transport system component
MISGDGRHIAYFASGTDCSNGTKRCVVLDGKVIPVSNDLTLLGGLALSFDGTHFAYPAFRDKKPLLVIDGQGGPVYDNRGLSIGGPKDLIFSPDGKRLAYVAAEGSLRHLSFRLVVDGKAGAEYDEIFNLIFSPDSKHIAFAAEIGKHLTVVEDGHPGTEYDEIYGPAFSPDSKHVVFGAQQGKKSFVVVNGQEGTYDSLTAWGVTDRTNSHDMSRPIYGVDSQSSVAYDDLSHIALRGVFVGVLPEFTHLAFSSDGSHMAYAAKKGGEWVIVVDGRVTAECKETGYGSPALSPDGKRLAFAERDGREGTFRLVVDGQPGAEYHAIYNPSFSPDGKHIAYTARKGSTSGEGFTLVEDGQEGPDFSGIGNWAFSSDSKHVAYAAQTQRGLIAYNDRGSMTDGAGKWSVVLDGQAGNEYSIILPGSLLFDPDGTVRFFAIQKEGHSLGNKRSLLYRVKYIPAP